MMMQAFHFSARNTRNAMEYTHYQILLFWLNYKNLIIVFKIWLGSFKSMQIGTANANAFYLYNSLPFL